MSRPSTAHALRRHRLAALLGVLGAVLMLAPSSAPGAGTVEGVHPAPLPDVDARAGEIAPTSEQIQLASDLGATVHWNRFGTPQSLTRHGGFLATGLAGD